MNTPEEQLERAEIQLREICLLCGFDPSEGEGTSPEEVTAAVKRKFDEHRSLETAAQGLRERFQKIGIAIREMQKDARTDYTLSSLAALDFKSIVAQLDGSDKALDRFDALKEAK